MKKVKVIFACCALLFLAVYVYLDMVVKLLNVYWLIGKYIGLLLVFASPLVFRLINKEKITRDVVITASLWFVFVGLRAQREISDYRLTVCRVEFGKEFNSRRRSLGVAQIPSDWSIGSSYEREVDWKGKDHVIGHTDKSVFIDSACEDAFERDNYELKPIRSLSRSISIGRVLNQGKSRDTDSYEYGFGNVGHSITKQQADSIFAVEKIQKDY